MKLLCIISVLCFMCNAHAQDTIPLSNKQNRKNRPSYLEIGAGGEMSTIRDFATSPLKYTGLGGNFSMGYLKTDQKLENHLIVRGSSSFNIPFGIDDLVSSINTELNLSYSHLFIIPRYSSDMFNVKMGGTFITNLNARVNPSLLNNSNGSELIANLMGTTKVTYDFSRNAPTYIDLWITKFKLNPRKRDLSFQANIGLINSHLRNGYAYLSEEVLANAESWFSGYKFDVFSGVRLSSSLDYTIYMKNNNAYRWSYTWDAYKTKEERSLESARHTIQFTLLFNLK